MYNCRINLSLKRYIVCKGVGRDSIRRDAKVWACDNFTPEYYECRCDIR